MSLAGELPELPQLAHNGWELATWVILAVVAIIMFWIWTEHRNTKSQVAGMASSVDTIEKQVANDHGEDNLREQLDRMERRIEDNADQADDLAADIRGLRKDVGGMRGEIRELGNEHRDYQRRIAKFVAREHPGAPPV